MALTFMAKFDEREGNSCHIHFSASAATDGALVHGRRRRRAGMSAVGRAFVAGQLAHMRELHPALRAEHQLLQAVRRRARSRRPRCGGGGTTAPARSGWSATGRRCGWRTGSPAATSTPTSPSRGMVAAGLDGIERGLELEAGVRRERLRPTGAERVPDTLASALDLWREQRLRAPRRSATRSSTHYANMARVELAAFDAAVTDWERFRGFERL